MPGSRSAPGVQNGYFESYKSEIAAYELDKLLGLNMVPVVVERRVNNDLGAAVMWIEGVRSWETVLPLPKPATWDFQLARMKMFDDLISNSDRNKGNLLVDADWHIFLIDHSRAFVTDMKLPQELQNIDRKLWERMLALDEPGLKTTMGTWLDGRQIQALHPPPGRHEEEDRRARRQKRRHCVLLAQRVRRDVCITQPG